MRSFMLMRWPSKKTGNREEQLTLSLSKVKKKEEKKQHKKHRHYHCILLPLNRARLAVSLASSLCAS